MDLPNDFIEVKNAFGYAILEIKDDDEKQDGIVHLTTLTVDEAFQSKGHGGNLLETILDDAHEYGCKKVIVHARPLMDDAKQNDLVRFYETHGFKKSDLYVALNGVYMEIDL